MLSKEELLSKIKNQRILFIATKNIDYIRIVQERKLLEQHGAAVDVIASANKSYLKRILHVYKTLLFTDVSRYDIVFIGFMAQMIVPFFPFKWKGRTIITDFFISIYDTLVDDRKKLKGQSALAKLVRYLDKQTIRRSNYIIADTKAHADYFAKELEAEPERTAVLYLEADTSIYYPRKTDRPDIYKGKYLVLYFGSILPLQGVDIILKAIDLLKKQQQIHFIMIGPIHEKYRKVTSDTVTYIDWLPQEQLAEYISYADLCLAGHFSREIGKASRTIAGKTYIYRAMDKKIVLGDSPANRELFQEDARTLYVEMGAPEALAECILRQAKLQK